MGAGQQPASFAVVDKVCPGMSVPAVCSSAPRAGVSPRRTRSRRLMIDMWRTMTSRLASTRRSILPKVASAPSVTAERAASRASSALITRMHVKPAMEEWSAYAVYAGFSALYTMVGWVKPVTTRSSSSRRPNTSGTPRPVPRSVGRIRQTLRRLLRTIYVDLPLACLMALIESYQCRSSRTSTSRSAIRRWP